MSFIKDGFLGPEAEEYKRKIVSDNKELFDLCFEVNKFAQEMKFSFEIHNQEEQEMILGCLFIRLLNNFQGIVMLCSYGLIIEAKILLRSMLEALFILKISFENKDFIKQYIKSDQLYRYKLLTIPENNSDSMFEGLKTIATEDLRKQIKRNIKADNLKENKIQELAKKAGLKNHYDSAYRLLSNTAHIGIRSLEEYLILDDRKQAKVLNFGPIEKDFDLVLVTTIDNLCLAFYCLFDFFKTGNQTLIDEFRNRALNLKKDNGI